MPPTATATVNEVAAGSYQFHSAMPKAWPNGSVKGLRARGGFTVDINWKNGKVISRRITSIQSREVKVRVNGAVRIQTPESAKN